MKNFEKSNWADREFAEMYALKADVIVPERETMLRLLSSFYLHFFAGKTATRTLDLGCGDGVLTEAVLRADGSVRATLVDASGVMTGLAEKRLKGAFKKEKAEFITETLEGLAAKKPLKPGFDFVFSALAIHHLEPHAKRALVEYVHSLLLSGGFFVNMDGCVPPSEALEQWYIEIWKARMLERQRELSIEVDRAELVRRLMDSDHHAKLQTLPAHLADLERAGFREVECYYKHGMFAMYGGRK